MKRIIALLTAVFVLLLPCFAEVDENGNAAALLEPTLPLEDEVSAPETLPPEVPVDDEAALPGDDSAGSDLSAASDPLPEIDDRDLVLVDGEIVEAEDPAPMPVIVVDGETEFPTVYAAGSAPQLDIVDAPPSNPPFFGCCYVTGTTSSGQIVTLYFPINYKSGYFGVDANGYLFNISSSSISGYYGGVYNNSVSASGFSYPRYRTGSGSSYSYIDLYLRPTASNMDIAADFEPVVTVGEYLPYVSIFLLGVLLVCFMKRS